MAQTAKPSGSSDFMIYMLKHVGTEYSVGWFSCVPSEDMNVEEIIEYLRSNPNDEFMHKYLLDLLIECDEHGLERLIETAKKGDFLLLASVYQAPILYRRFQNLRKKFEGIDIQNLASSTPLIYIRWSLDKNHLSRCFWMKVFSDNTYNHKPLPSLSHVEFPIPFDLEGFSEDQNKIVHIRDVYSTSNTKSLNTGTSLRTKPPQETVEKILNTVTVRNLLAGSERKTETSLTPYAMERFWNLDVKVSVGRNRWKLKGYQTSYGKGLGESQARASSLMEVIERYSAFASFSDSQSIGYKKEFNLVKSSYSDLKDRGLNVLDPNSVNLEIVYENQGLYWIIAEQLNEQGSHEIYVPAQFVFLFCNLDEMSLTSGITSNGLASGNTMDEAKLHGLLEYIERDSERIMLYSQERCFSLEAENPVVRDILTTGRGRGIHVQFLDLTSDFGIPCHKAFIQSTTGVILKGCGAHLDGEIAAARALTELAYHPYLGRSIPPSEGFKTIKYEQLPNYSSGDVSQDLRTLERLLIMNGYFPIYADLMRRDLDIPVVRIIIPGLEMMPVSDTFSNFNKRQFKNYLKIIKAEKA